MLLRWLLALLIAMVALPATAMPACHPPAPPEAGQAMHQGHHAPAEQSGDPASLDPLCVGCIAPATVKHPRLDAPDMPAAGTPVARIGLGAPLGELPPATPPPRSGA